jgi:uncharacterized protein YkwD
MAMTALALTAGVPAATAGAAPALKPAVERAVMREMNAVRTAHGLAPLRTVRPLMRPARAHSTWLARTGAFQHEGPGGTPFWTRLVRAGFPRSAAMGENLAMAGRCDAAAARQVVQMWMNSPGHRANLLSPRFRLAGVGAAGTAGCDRLLVTADYGGAP